MKRLIFALLLLPLFMACDNKKEIPIYVIQGESEQQNKNSNESFYQEQSGRKPMQQWIKCYSCDGSGQCHTCYGLGYSGSRNDRCWNCGGTGKCTYCAGNGGHNEIVYVN